MFLNITKNVARATKNIIKNNIRSFEPLSMKYDNQNNQNKKNKDTYYNEHLAMVQNSRSLNRLISIAATSVSSPSFTETNKNTPVVKLVSCSQPSEEFAQNGLENVQDLIAFCAKVSNPSNQINKATSEKLIKYLIKHQHWSPLEMVSACIEINTTRDIARQILRHRSFSFQEFSQRYAEPSEFGEQFVIRETRLQDTKNRQNSIETEDIELQTWWEEQQAMVIYNAGKIYQEAIDRGIAKEQARAILPEGNTKSRLYMNGTIRSWIHYIDLRAANGTQKEHIEIAKVCAKVISDIFPVADNLLDC
jgi:thymidylate synthase (FAD)